MDGDRPMVDGRDIPESKLQDAIRRPRKFVFDWFDELVSDYNSQTDHVGTQDEASEARAVGNGIRPESDMRSLEIKPTVFDDITSEFTKKLSFRFPNYGLVKPVGHCKLEKMPDGSIHAIIKYH